MPEATKHYSLSNLGACVFQKISFYLYFYIFAGSVFTVGNIQSL